MSGISLSPLHLAVIFIIYTLILLIIVSAYYKNQLQKLKSEQETALHAVKGEQTKNMITLLRPHFIFNCFSAIMYLCKTDPGCASERLCDLAEYLRAKLQMMEGRETPEIPFRSELTRIESYTSLEKLRFQEQLDFHFDIQSKAFMVPSMSLFTEVENAIKRARGLTTGMGIVSICSYETADGCIVEITDNSEASESRKTFRYTKS